MIKYKLPYQDHYFTCSENVSSIMFRTIKKCKCYGLVVKFKSGLSYVVRRFNKEIGVNSCVKIKDLDQVYLIFIKIKSLNKLVETCKIYHNSGLVEYCVPYFNYKVKTANPWFNDTFYNDQWYYKNSGQLDGKVGEDIKLEEALQYISLNNIQLNSDVKVAILDDGIDPNHLDINDNIIVSKFDILDNDHTPTPTAGMTHGTFIAGIISAMANNSIGIAGINPVANLIVGRIYGNNFNSIRAEKGIRKAILDGAQIINLSWGIPSFNPQIAEAIKEAYHKNILVIAAAGNYYNGEDSKVLFPGTMDEVLTVGACDHRGKWLNIRNFPFTNREKFGSRYGRQVDLVAPGIQILTTRYDISSIPSLPSYSYFDGTSASAAIVTGVASLLLSINPRLNNKELKSLLLSTTDDISKNHLESENVGVNHIGHGRINALKAVKAIL